MSTTMRKASVPMTLKARVRSLGHFNVPDPDHGDLRLSLYPIAHERNRFFQLPPPFDDYWNAAVNNMLAHVPVQDEEHQHYVTIDSKYFPVEESLRREGIHVDGNFCVDPSWPLQTWGGDTGKTWAGARWDPEQQKGVVPWVNEYGVTIPIGEYISGDHGGILCASSHYGCRAWAGERAANVGDGGALDGCWLTEENAVPLQEHHLWFMSSDTPHETLPIPKGERRTLIRITLDHRYDNSDIRS